ncbi:hypothetical protein [Azospirillum sp. B4]|uniref:hypothetical protein n=1 Tax=Azospirillum sp. B4 TaxID=95605 RepID=UPI0003452B1E|nr:hypothetical protein [Azospirillum sp. B4]
MEPPPPGGPPGGLTRQHRALLIILGLSMIGGRLWDMNHDRAAGPGMNILVIVLGIVVLAVAFVAGRGRSGR